MDPLSSPRIIKYQLTDSNPHHPESTGKTAIDKANYVIEFDFPIKFVESNSIGIPINIHWVNFFLCKDGFNVENFDRICFIVEL